MSGYEEFYSNGSLTIAPVTSETETTKSKQKMVLLYIFCIFPPSLSLSLSPDVIMVGSFSGILRAYSPSHGSFSPDHLLLETQFSQPIINLGVAKVKR